jgi:hypothetical protein
LRAIPNSVVNLFASFRILLIGASSTITFFCSCFQVFHLSYQVRGLPPSDGVHLQHNRHEKQRLVLSGNFFFSTHHASNFFTLHISLSRLQFIRERIAVGLPTLIPFFSM